MKRYLFAGVTLLALAGAVGVGSRVLGKEAGGVVAPKFEVDPMWPKPLPNHWRIGMTIGVSVDAQDHVWIIHRPETLQEKEKYPLANPPAASCCFPASPVLEFDQAGSLIGNWGGKGEGYEWPVSNHGITVDYKGNVWIGGNGQGDAQVLKFTQNGKLLMQIGHQNKSQGSNDTANFSRPAKLFIDQAANELYVADG